MLKASDHGPGLNNLGIAIDWYNTLPNMPDWGTVQPLITNGELGLTVWPEGIVLYEPRQTHAEWLAVACDNPKTFAKQNLKHWLAQSGFNSAHWALTKETLPLDTWSYVLPQAGFTLSAQAQLTLDFNNPVQKAVFQQRLAKGFSPAKTLTCRVLADITPDHPVWSDVAQCLQQAYQNSPDMDWLPIFRQNPLQVLQHQLQQTPDACLTLVYDGQTMAGVCLQFLQPPVSQLGFWAVIPPYKGCGQWLLTQALQALPPTINRVQACTHTRLSSVIRAYQSFGFTLDHWQTIVTIEQVPTHPARG